MAMKKTGSDPGGSNIRVLSDEESQHRFARQQAREKRYAEESEIHKAVEGAEERRPGATDMSSDERNSLLRRTTARREAEREELEKRTAENQKAQEKGEL